MGGVGVLPQYYDPTSKCLLLECGISKQQLPYMPEILQSLSCCQILSHFDWLIDFHAVLTEATQARQPCANSIWRSSNSFSHFFLSYLPLTSINKHHYKIINPNDWYITLISIDHLSFSLSPICRLEPHPPLIKLRNRKSFAIGTWGMSRFV